MRVSLKRKVSAFLVLMMFLTISAFNGGQVFAEASNLEKGQVVHVNLRCEPFRLDACRGSSLYSKQVTSEIMEGLTRLEQDEEGEKVIKPAGAESWECSEDGTEWIFHLRDFSWEDGKKVTAKDYAYGILRNLDPCTGSLCAWLIAPYIKNGEAYNKGEVGKEDVAVEAIDDRTLKITLESPCPYFLDLTYFTVMYPHRKDIVEKYGDDYGMNADKIISCGPFGIESWTHDEEIVLKKNNTYWDKESVKLSKINFKFIREDNDAANKLLYNKMDISSISQKEMREYLESIDKFYNIEKYKEGVRYLSFNHNNKYFKNDKIRKAFIIAHNREGQAENYEKINEPAYSWCPPTIQIEREDFRKKINDEPVKRLIEENSDPKALLIEGLKEIGEDPNPANMDIKLTYGIFKSVDEKRIESIKKGYKEKLGVDIKDDEVEWAIQQMKIDEGDYDFTESSWWGDFNDPFTYFEMWKSDSFYNGTGWKNEEYNQLINKAAKSVDQEERFEAFKRAENILLYEEGVVSPGTFPKSKVYVNKRIKNVMYPRYGILELKYAYVE